MFTSRKQKNKCSTWSWKGPYQPKILSEYVDFLRDHRGLSESTIRFRKNDVISFLQPLRIQSNNDIGKLSAKQIYDHIIKTAKTMPLPSRRHIVASIRSFLKFAHLKGYVQRNLTEAVPVIGTPRLGSIPRGIPWESVEGLLAASDCETHTGRRNYAVLQLLATYGVRIGQIAKLRLKDINWRTGSIHFQSSKWGSSLCFPLHPDVADALLAYIQKTRGKSLCPEVFLAFHKTSPLGSAGLSCAIKRCFQLAGISARGAHAIRHAFATRLMEHDTPLKTIADLLGHQSISTTFIYTKVDLKHLRHVAHEWPEVLS